MVPVGRYDILLFAGNRAIVSDLGIPLLLASAYRQEHNIVLEETNTIYLDLKLVEVKIDVPELIEAGSVFEVKVRVNFHNPFVDYSHGSIQYIYETWVWDTHADGRGEMDGPNHSSYTGEYTFTVSLVAPDENGNGGIHISASLVAPFEGDGEFGEWHVSYLQEFPFVEYFRTYFDFRVPETNIVIRWPEN